MPSKTPKYSPVALYDALNDATAFCEENSLEVIARQMAKDMLKIKELEASLKELVIRTEPIGWVVKWEVELDAETPRGAAEKALIMHRDPESIATFFKVENVKTGESFNVDLLLG